MDQASCLLFDGGTGILPVIFSFAGARLPEAISGKI
jgi:hypothetical protein